MSGGASFSSSSRPLESEVSNAGIVDIDEFPVLEALPCFDKRKVGTPQTVNLNRVLLPTGEALSSFASTLHFMGGKLRHGPYGGCGRRGSG